MPKLFKIIASELNCSWSLDPSKDGLFGATKEDGTWNGIIGELIRGELDISLADLSVTSERARVRKDIWKNHKKTFERLKNDHLQIYLT